MDGVGNKKPVNHEAQSQDQLEKSYTIPLGLDQGAVITICFQGQVNELDESKQREILKEFAKCSHNFYMMLANWLNKVL